MKYVYVYCRNSYSLLGFFELYNFINSLNKYLTSMKVYNRPKCVQAQKKIHFLFQNLPEVRPKKSKKEKYT